MIQDDTKQPMDDDEIFEDEGFDDGFDEEFDDEFDDALEDGFDEGADGDFDDLADDYGDQGGEDEWDEGFDEELGEDYDEEYAEEGASTGKKSSKGNLVIIGAGAIVGVIVLFFMMSGGGDAPAPAPDAPAAQQAATKDAGEQSTAEAMPPQPQAPVSKRDIIYGRTGHFKQEDTSSVDNPQGGILHDDSVMEAVKDELSSIEFTDEVYTGTDEDFEELPDAASETLKKWNETDAPVTSKGYDSIGDVLTPVPNLGLGGQDDFETVEMYDKKPDAVTAIEQASEGPAEVDEEQNLEQPSDDFFNTPSEPVDTDQVDTTVDEDMAVQPSVTTEAPADSAEIDRLNKKMELLFARLDQVESKLDNSGSAGGASNAEVRELRNTVKELERKVASLSAKSKSAPKASSKQTSKPVYAPPPISSGVRPGPSTVSKSVQPKTSTVSAATKTNMNHKWTLRAAQNGNAMVSLSGHNEIRDVKIGDRLAGLGRITSIGRVEGKWVVQGTQGHITQ